VSTDNLAEYFYLDNNNWLPDLNRTNHFLYTENIHALYGNIEQEFNKVTLQGGLRYEYTSYDGDQLGNAARKDSSFSRRYNSLFPTIFFSYKVDSSNTISISAGRRIDRPAFQKLNPFVFIINKYTNQVGNPYFKPQYTWNFVANHLYKELLVTSVSYSYVKDYFSQIFLSDTSGNIVYTEGNLGRMQSAEASVSLHVKPFKWWTLNLQADFIYKKIEGTLWKDYTAEISQLNVNMTNQLQFNKGWAAELSGFYITKAQNDIQEILEPNGQVNAGISKQLLKKQGTIRLNIRDLFWTNRMAGLTHFQQTDEYFTIKRDSRVVNITFTYRFGKAYKTALRRGSGAQEEVNRVGAGG
jgi:iron complex outermembrane recepter protein